MKTECKNKKTLSLEEIKKKELEILISFSIFCKNNSLKYYLAYGTLLGSVRHQGFIPWDDDIDVFMPRPDYEKFIMLTGFNQIKENLETRLYRDCKNPNIYPFVKLIDTNTVVFEKGKRKKDVSGLWIDVFPLDGYPKSKDEAVIIFQRYKKLRNIYDLAATNPWVSQKTLLKKIIKTFIAPLVKLYGIKRMCKKIEENAKTISYDASELVADFTWGDTADCFMRKSELEPAEEMLFEGHYFSVPSCWKNYLELNFGDYMTLPPEEERIPHGFAAYTKEN